MVADRRAGRGLSALYKLATVTNRRTHGFRGFYQSGVQLLQFVSMLFDPDTKVLKKNCDKKNWK